MSKKTDFLNDGVFQMGEYRANGGDSVGYSLCTAALASLALKLVTRVSLGGVSW